MAFLRGSALAGVPDSKPWHLPASLLLACLPVRLSQGAVITQCFPTHYYAVHETGHRMGFRHANVYQ